MINNIEKILYFGASLNIQIVKDFPNVKDFVLIDNQPRSKSDRYYFSDRDYNDKFIDNLMSVTKDNGFDLVEIFILDESYHTKILNIKKMIYYSFFTLPPNLDPELYMFYNKDTDQIIKYYISTNIDYNMNPILFNDIKSCNTLIINEYFPSIKLFEYFDKMEILIGYIKTFFSSNDDYINKISSKFNKYYLFNDDNNLFIECKNFMDIILNKIRMLNEEDDSDLIIY